LRPTEWRAIWLVTPPGKSRLVGLADALAAFAGGAPARFAALSLLLHPRGLLWLLAVGLTPWIAILIGLGASHQSGLVGYGSTAMCLWVAFDCLAVGALFRVALRPSPRAILVLLAAASADAALSGRQLAAVGLGSTAWELLLRLAAVSLPMFGMLALVATAAEWRHVPGGVARAGSLARTDR
jgi:hypothetical protein